MAVYRAICCCVIFEERGERIRKTLELRNVTALSIPDEPRVQKSVKPDGAYLNKCLDNHPQN